MGVFEELVNKCRRAIFGYLNIIKEYCDGDDQKKAKFLAEKKKTLCTLTTMFIHKPGFYVMVQDKLGNHRHKKISEAAYRARLGKLVESLRIGDSDPIQLTKTEMVKINKLISSFYDLVPNGQ